jgi:hypothetical protein
MKGIDGTVLEDKLKAGEEPTRADVKRAAEQRRVLLAGSTRRHERAPPVPSSFSYPDSPQGPRQGRPGRGKGRHKNILGAARALPYARGNRQI